MYMINGYLFRLVLDTNGYVWMQQITIFWMDILYDMSVYLRWKSHLNTHGYAKWNMDMNG
jgi:hypothetical protein